MRLGEDGRKDSTGPEGTTVFSRDGVLGEFEESVVELQGLPSPFGITLSGSRTTNPPSPTRRPLSLPYRFGG